MCYGRNIYIDPFFSLSMDILLLEVTGFAVARLITRVQLMLSITITPNPAVPTTNRSILIPNKVHHMMRGLRMPLIPLLLPHMLSLLKLTPKSPMLTTI